jgi:hypothetical protein
VSHHRTTTGAAYRRFTLGSGPLKRTSDRLQHLGRILLVCGLLFGVAVALAVATGGYTNGVAKSVAQSAARHQVTAQLTQDARPPEVEASTVSGWGSASVTWHDAVGNPHQSVVSVRAGAKAGTTTRVWIDAAGDRTTRPLSRGDAVSGAIGYGLLTYLAIAVVALTAYRVFRGGLDRSRTRRWATEWAAIEPVWSRTVP